MADLWMSRFAACQALGPDWTIRARQLYHDREEVTVAALPPA